VGVGRVEERVGLKDLTRLFEEREFVAGEYVLEAR